ncbi:hypothetical protein BY458DRAFT_427893 [Sporodiniella umbellata]|nr:hypothetical protein BY458DRAFT_427893 [Sporodiniella umbellata]
MLESVVSTLLNRVLGEYVSNLNYNQLKIGIWSGEVKLRDLKLRREALDKLNLPVDVLEGYLGELTLTIPWSNLRGKPVLVDIKDVYVLAVPRNESTMTAEELIEREQEAKMAKLESSELMHNDNDVSVEAKNDTFANQLMTRILNNLQFSIKNIHIRYEDNVSTQHRFAAGITLNELSAITTDENWVANTLGEAANTIFKLATLESLSIYWDTNIDSIAKDENHESFKSLIATKDRVPSEHQYILRPVSGTGRVKFNKHFGHDIPKIETSLLFDELSFTVDNEQYRDTILMIDLFHSYLKKQKYKALHPPSEMTPKTHPLEYFKFAGKAILSEIHERNAKWTWERIRERRDDRKAYIDCYVSYKFDRAAPEELKKLEDLERKLTFEDLRFYRGLARPKLRAEKARLAAIDKRRKEEAAKRAATQSWGISNWWYGGGAGDGSANDEEMVITEEQKQEFYDVIDYDADKEAIAAAVDLPKDTTLLLLNMSLNRGSFNVRKNPHNSPVDLLSLVFDKFSLGFTKYVESFVTTAALGDMSLYDGQRPNSPHYKLIGAKGKEVVHRKSMTLDSQLKNMSNPLKDPFFTVTFEYKPLDERADNAAALYMRNIDIVYNPQVIHDIFEFFTPPETSADSIHALIEVAGDTLEGIKKQTRASLEYALEQHATFDLKVDMDAPVIILPENCSSTNCSAIVIDAGHINVESNLSPPEKRAQLKSKPGSEMTAEDNSQLHSLLFDKFTVQLTQTKILVGDSLDTCLVQVRQPRPDLEYLHLVDRIDMTFLLELCIIRKSVDLPRLKVSGHLPLLKVNFSDTKYKTIMQLPHLIEASGLLGEKKTNDLNSTTRSRIDQGWFSLMGNPLWNGTDDDILLQSDSESSDVYTDSLEGTVDTEATKITAASEMKTKKDKVNIEERLFELDFMVDQVLANILAAEKDQGSSSELLLCEVNLKSLKLHYSMRPMDMAVRLSLNSLDVTDKMKHGDEFKYLVTSDQHILQPDISNNSNLKELVNVEYIQCDHQNPEYITKYKGVDQTVHVTLSTLNFIVTRSSVLRLHSFIMDTFVDTETKSVESTIQKSNVTHQDPIDVENTSKNGNNNSIYVRLLLDSVNFVLNNDGERLATGELSLGDLSTIVADGQVNIAAKFANFTLTDDISPVKTVGSRKLSNQLLTIQGEELVDLKYKSFLNDGRNDYPGYDHSVFLRMGSAQFRFLEEPVHQLLLFLNKFAEMKTTYDIARAAALESAQQLSQAATKTHFDVIVKTPVVLFPEFHQNSSDLVVAHLGEIWASNQFVNTEHDCINTIKAGLRAINLTSKFSFERPETQIQTLPIVDDIDISLSIKVPENGSPETPVIDIDGSVSDISMRLTERQYIFLMETINMFSRVLTYPNEENTADSKRNSVSFRRPSQANRNSVLEGKPDAGLTQVQMVISVKTIKLEVYSGIGADIQSPKSLASFALHNTKVNLKMQKDNTIDVFLVVPSLTVDDTRPNINSEFKNIMPVITDGNQFELQLDLKAPNPNRIGVAMVTIRDSKVILSLDHAFLLSKFFTLPFQSQSSPTEQRSSIADEEAVSPTGVDLSYVIKVLNAEFVLLANPDRVNSEAVVLSAEELMITQQSKAALVVKQMGMFLCTMDTRQKSTLRLIQPFDINMSMNSNPRNEFGGLLTDIVINIDPLIMRVSYRDMMLITDIFNKAFELHNAGIDSDKQISRTEYAQGFLSSSATPQKETSCVDAQESLRVSFQGAQVILIEELHETPMVVTSLKPFNLHVANWTKDVSTTVQLHTYINYFNIKNSHWEPLLEPWNFKLELFRNPSKDNTTHIKLISDTILNLNVTHTLLESAVSTMKLLDKERDIIYSGERGAIAPYELRNRTGYRITVWNTTVSEDPVLTELKNNDNIPWWFEDWIKRREMTSSTSNNINVQIDGAQWKSLRDVQLDTEGEHMHPLEPRVDNVQHHIVFDVKLINNVKVVTIRSAFVIENRTLLSIDLIGLDPLGGKSEVKIAPGEDYAVPIEQSYTNRFCVRPDEGFGYQWTQKAFHWKDFASPVKPSSTCSCLSSDRSMPPFIFQIDSRLDRNHIIFGQYPAMAIRLSAPIEIENLLPFDFNFRIVDKTTGQEFSSYLRKGGVMPIHVIENGHLVLMNVHLPETEYAKSDYAILSTKRTDDLDVDRSFELVNKSDKSKLYIRINTIEIQNSGGAKKYSLFSPYIIMNKTGLPIRFKEKLTWSDTFVSSGDMVTVCKPGPKPQPFMYSYPNVDNRNRTLIKVDQSEWSRPLSFEAIGSVYDVVLPNRSEEIHVGIHVQEGQDKFKLTKTITITPRFILSNQMNQSIRYRIPETREDYVLEVNQRIPLYNIRAQNEKQLSIKLEGFSNSWSAPFNIRDIGNVHVRLSNDYGQPDTLVRVSIVLQGATIFIVLTKESSWPYLLVNMTNEDMIFHQEDPVLLQDDSAPVRNLRIKRYRLPAKQSVPYSWDLPAYKEKKIILSINGRERSINLQEIGTLPPFRHASRSGRSEITSIDVKIEGARRILELTPYKPSESQFKPVNDGLSRSSSVLSTATREGFEIGDVDMSVNAVFQIQVKELGVSFIDRRLQELAYVTFKGINLKLTDSALYHSLRWNIDWVQIDNQMYGSVFPILLYPTNSTNNGRKNNKDKILPTVQLALDRVKDDSHGVMYFKYFSILLQEMSVELDETFVYAMIDFVHVDGPLQPLDTDVWEYSTDIPDIDPDQNTAQIYFEMFSIQPIQFNLSFLRVYQEDGNKLLAYSPVAYIVNALTMTIGNINNASLKFNALAIENVMANGPDLANKISIHYSDQCIYQFHRILGSADFLGNPVGLFNNLSSGVVELFYEPWQGLIMSDKPQDLGYGIAKGFSGFIRKSVFGVSDSFSRFTGSIGKGLSAATMDREYQDRRRTNMSRNRPKHALYGVAQGATSFANSFASGMSGLVTRPVEGASKDGVGGFLRGVGKGVVGAVTKPVVGVFDLTSNISEGIRNTTTMNETNMIERTRYPRYIGPSGILKPYLLREAIGQHWLKDVGQGKYGKDVYLAHCHVQNDERVAMLTDRRVMLVRTRRLAVEWQEPFSEIQTFKREPTGIIIYLRQSIPERFLIISDKQSREEFFKKIEGAVRKYNLTRRPAE